MLRLMLAAVFALGLSGCLGKAVAQLVKPPEIKGVSFNPGKFDLNEQGFVLNVKMKNPNFFAVPLKTITYDVFMNGQPVAQGRSAQKNIRLGAGQTDEVKLGLTTNLLKVLGNRAIFAAGKGLNYSVRGSVLVDGLDYAVPFEEKGKLNLNF